MKALVDFAKEEPFIAFLIVAVVCAAVVQVVGIVVLHHPVDFNF